MTTIDEIRKMFPYLSTETCNEIFELVCSNFKKGSKSLQGKKDIKTVRDYYESLPTDKLAEKIVELSKFQVMLLKLNDALGLPEEEVVLSLEKTLDSPYDKAKELEDEEED